MESKKIFKNIFFGLGGKLITMMLGLIVPRLFLKSYGSEINGLLSTVNNIYTYLALLEAGIGASAIQMLYRPINNADTIMINKILSTVKRYYRRMAKYYAVGVIASALLLPFVFTTTIPKYTIFIIVVLQGLASLVNFYALSGLSVLLSAEGREYVISNIAFFVTVLSNLVKIILVNLQVDIIVLQFSYFIISLLSILVYMVYFKKNYPWIDRTQVDETITLKQRGAFLQNNIVYLIFNNTDTIIISLFCGLKFGSVYAIYNMIFTYVLTLINSVFNGLKYMLGKTYNQDRNKYIRLHDSYKSIYCAFVFSMFSVCYVLILPFMKLYTSGINDVAYVDKYLPLLFCLVNLLSACRSTENNLISVAFHAKQTLPRAYAEAIINIGVSLVCVNVIGIYGCLIGTIVSLFYRTNDIIIYANKTILNRKPIQAYKTVLSNFTLFFIICIASNAMNLSINGYLSFLVYGVVFSVISLFVFFLLAFVTNKECATYLFEYIHTLMMRTKRV